MLFRCLYIEIIRANIYTKIYKNIKKHSKNNTARIKNKMN